jgi:hypothetical protein
MWLDRSVARLGLLEVLLQNLLHFRRVIVHVALALEECLADLGGQIAPLAAPVRPGFEDVGRLVPVRVVRLLGRIARILRALGLVLVLVGLLTLLLLLPLARAA